MPGDQTTRGGRRPGAGRPPGQGRGTNPEVRERVPAELAAYCKAKQAEEPNFLARLLQAEMQQEDTMQTFSISRKSNSLGEIRATDHQQAADRWARREYGRTASALLVQGEPGKSGLYQAYKPARGGGQTSVGENFRVI